MELFCELSFPQLSGKWVTIQISFKRNHRIFNVGPWFWPPVSWKTYHSIWTILTLEFSVILMHLPFWPECVLILRLLLVLHSQVCDADEPCSVNTACEPESSFPISPRSTTQPLYFWYFGSYSAFLGWQIDVHQRGKMDCSLPFLCFQDDLPFLLLTLAMFCPLLFLHPEFSSLGEEECTCAHDSNDSVSWTPSQLCDLHDLSME